MKEKLIKECLKFRRFLFLFLFIMGIILIFSNTASMVSFDHATVVAVAADRRTVYLLVSLFGFVCFFTDVILNRKNKDIE